jgi:transposase-like protein
VTLTEQWSEPGDELPVGIPRTRTIAVEALGLLETQLPDVLLESQAGIRQYADRPELSREITTDGLKSRRSMSYAVIAQTPGDVTLSSVSLPWFNVTTERWEVAELPPLALRVTPGTDVTDAAPVPEPSAVPTVAVARERNVWPWISGALALTWLATLALWWRRYRGRGHGRTPVAVKLPTAPTAKPLRKILRDLESACAVNDPAAARNALLAFAEARFTANPPRSLGALAALLPDSVGREVLTLEAHIYGAAAGAWRGDGLKTVLGELESAGTLPEPPAGEPLLPLYR